MVVASRGQLDSRHRELCSEIKQLEGLLWLNTHSPTRLSDTGWSISSLLARIDELDQQLCTIERLMKDGDQ